MNRYQFEDLISDYIENNLNLSKRKEFETYIREHPDGKGLVDSVQSLMGTMKSMSTVSPSVSFMENLQRRIEVEKKHPSKSSQSTKTFFGFTPVYAGMMAVVLVALALVGMELLPREGSPQQSLHQFTHETQPQTTSQSSPDQLKTDTFTQTETDSSDIEDRKPTSPYDLNDRVKFVKDR